MSSLMINPFYKITFQEDILPVNRSENRTPQDLRSVKIITQINEHAEGSALIEWGKTKVYCTVSVEEKVPSFLEGKGKGWVTAEYNLLPRATHTRNKRERGKIGGRTMEIQRLIGRSLRAVIDFEALGERTLTIDCDVLQADGGTRCASITGAFVAMKIAIDKLMKNGRIKKDPIRSFAAAVSVGIYKGEMVLDMDYVEDSSSEVDLNVVATGEGDFIEIQGTAEGKIFSRNDLNALVDLALGGIQKLIQCQKDTLQNAAL